MNCRRTSTSLRTFSKQTASTETALLGSSGPKFVHRKAPLANSMRGPTPSPRHPPRPPTTLPPATASSSVSHVRPRYIVLCFDLPDDNCLDTGPPCLPFSHCEQCSSSQCILCEHHFCLANNSSCQCCSGWEVNNLCTSIAGCVSPYFQPDGTPSCLQCDDTQF